MNAPTTSTAFDPKKPYATIYGDPKARYEQMGKLYDHNGKPLDKTLHLPKKK